MTERDDRRNQIVKMWWSVFLLVVMCQCSFSTCHHYEYHFINENKTWEEAQSYCREKYTDLAKVYDMTVMKRLKNSAGSSTGAWIGLKGGGTKMWHWSQPGKVYSENTANWQQEEPNDLEGREDCVRIREDKKWEDVECTRRHRFICYNESSSENIHWIDETKTWTEAQSYCRKHHTDLVSRDQFEGLDTGGVTQNDIKWWIGLFRDFWAWSDGSNSSFRHWEPFQSGREQNRCAYLKESGKWDSADCSERRSFVCYEAENMILIRQNLTWDGAVKYCREHHHDLVSITTDEQQRQVAQKAENATTPYVWLGLRYSCSLDLWFWVNDNVVCDDNWAEGKDPECSHCVAMNSTGHHEWSERNESDLYNFICVL